MTVKSIVVYSTTAGIQGLALREQARRGPDRGEAGGRWEMAELKDHQQ